MSLTFTTQCTLAFYLIMFILCARRIFSLFSDGLEVALSKPEKLGFQSQFLVGAPWLSLDLLLEKDLPSVFWSYSVSLLFLSFMIITKARSKKITLIIKMLASFAASALINYIFVVIIIGTFIGTPESIRHKLK